jgi:hypothetical protein
MRQIGDKEHPYVGTTLGDFTLGNYMLSFIQFALGAISFVIAS